MGKAVCLSFMLVWKNLHEIITSPLFSATFNILSLGGLYIAWRAWKDSFKQSKQLDGMLDKVNRIASALTTRVIGEYPSYIPDIEKLVSASRNTLTIVSIAPGFGSFSAPQQWAELRIALQKHQEAHKPVTLITGSAENRLANLRSQFNDALMDWTTWIRAEENSEKVRLFVHRYSGLGLNIHDSESFLQAISTVQEHLISEVYFNAEVRFTSEYLPVIAWIADELHAIFGLSNPSARPTGFYTEDKNIIDSLTRLADRFL